MNVTLASIVPLPNALSQPRSNGNSRRHLIGRHDLDPGALQHFNDLMAQINLDHIPLERDQVATAARELIDQPRDGLAPHCIRQRMRRAGALDLMLSDPEWQTQALAAVTAALVIEYLRGSFHLIPNALPVVGRLDDAVMVETAWPVAASEVRNFLDFCRLRRIEAELRGESRLHFGFTRDDWTLAREAEAEWIAHCQRVASSSYVPSAASLRRFRVS